MSLRRDDAQGDTTMAPNEARREVGNEVILHTTTSGDLQGRMVSCTLETVWLVDEEDHDLIVPLGSVRWLEKAAA